MAERDDQGELRIDLPLQQLAAFCQKWKIVELSVFGSALRDDFGPDSDIDFLAMFDPESDWSLLDHAQMEIELPERGKALRALIRSGVGLPRDAFHA